MYISDNLWFCRCCNGQDIDVRFRSRTHAILCVACHVDVLQGVEDSLALLDRVQPFSQPTVQYSR